jgi:2'-5' RNA ligase
MDKQLTGNSLPGYRIADYMIILNPHEELRKKISELREDFSKEFGVLLPPSKPNLLLASFKQLVMMENKIIRKLDIIAMAQYPFKVELKDFGSYPSHTIFINSPTKVPVQDLIKHIRTETGRLMKLDSNNKPYFNLEPHINVATKLNPVTYERAWLKYLNTNFTGRFIAEEMLMLKRHEGDKSWQVLKSFKFQNLPIEVKQGNLFV